MLDKEGFHCDGANCRNYKAFHGRAFKTVLAEIKKLGWNIRKRAGAWFHYCPACATPPHEPPAQRQDKWYDDL